MTTAALCHITLWPEESLKHALSLSSKCKSSCKRSDYFTVELCSFSASTTRLNIHYRCFFSCEIRIPHPPNWATLIICVQIKKSSCHLVCICACLRVCRRDVLDELVTLHNFSNQFLPNALRDFFRHIHAPEERGEYLETLITKFSHRFCACNPGLVRELGLSPGQY